MTPTLRGKLGNAAGLAGQWMQFVLCAWVAFRSGSYLFTSLYLLASAAPSVLPIPKVRAIGILAPAGVLWMAAGEPSALVIIAAGWSVGLGAAACGRPLALTAGITGGPGWAGPIGAASCLFLPALLGVQASLWVAAALLVVAVVAGESHDRRGPVPPALFPAALVLAAVAGLRVLEPGFDSGSIRTPAAFATAWAIGAQVGWRPAPSADARAVLAAPFLGAMALTGLGSVRGPGLIFLYGFLAACCALVTGGGSPRLVGPMSLSRRSLLVGTAAGALWANAPFDFQVLAWGTSGAVIAGGFISSVAARRVPAPPVVEEQLPVQEPEELFDQRRVVELLLDATRTANQIRGAALGELRGAQTAISPIGAARMEAEGVIDDLLERLRNIKSSLARVTEISEG